MRQAGPSGIARLGLEKLRVPHKDRYSLLWLERGNLIVRDGTLRFLSTGSPDFEPGAYDIPYETISLILLGPGTSLTHDVLRLTASHGVGIAAIGENGVRLYTAPPLSPDTSLLARAQVRHWIDPEARAHIVLKMYRIRFGEQLPTEDIAELRGIEGIRVREMYRQLARQYGLTWSGRRYNRAHPEENTDINNAINHAANAAYAAAAIAVAATATIPQLGFIHESAYDAFGLDIADIYRMTITIPAAFQGLRAYQERPELGLERNVRKAAGRVFSEEHFIHSMIETIKTLFDDDPAESA